MGRLKEYIKSNKKLHSKLYPFVFAYRYFLYADCRTAFFYAKYFLRKIGIVKCDPILERLEHKYKGSGKKVYVVATGPSLRLSDLEWIEKNGAITISCNSIYKIYGQTDWRPTYYFVNDDLMSKDYPDLRYDGFAREAVVLPESMKRFMHYPMPDDFAFVPICYLDHWLIRPGRFEKYSTDLKYVCYDLYTVTNSMIAFAEFLGFDEIYLLGVDYNFRGVNAHVGDEKGLGKVDMDAERIQVSMFLRGTQFLKKDTDRRNVKIYNATRGGSLELFPRVDMDELMSDLK